MWIFALFGGLVLMPSLIEARALLDGRRWPYVAAGALAFAALAWVPAALAPAYSADRQQQWTLQFVVYGRDPQPFWSIVNDGKPLPAAFKAFGRWELTRVPGLGPRERWIARTRPQPGLVQPRLLPAGTMTVPGGRRVRLRIQANGADSVILVADPGAPVTAAGVPGQLRPFTADTTGPTRTLACTGRSCDGATVEFQLRGNAPLSLLVIGTRWSLPPSAAPLRAARPANAQPQYSPDSTILLSRVRI